MQYIEPRGRVFWFRRRAPDPLKPGMPVTLGDMGVVVGKNGYVRFSLGTTDRREAAKKARKYAHYLDEAAQRRSRQTPTEQVPAPLALPTLPTREEIEFAAESMYAMLLAADEDTAEKSLNAFFSEGESGEIREPDRYVWSPADLPPASVQGQVKLLKQLGSVISFFLFQTSGKVISEVTPDFLPFADAFRRYVSALEKRKASEHVPTPPLPTGKGKWTWEDAYNYYLVQRSGLSDATKANYGTAWNSLAESAKCPPSKLTTEQVVAWRDGLLKKLKPQTVKSRLTHVAAIWRESRINQKIDRSIVDPFEGLYVKVDDNAGSSRQQFSDTELRKIFSVPPLKTARAISIHAGYWLPLLALYHGSRLEEVTGLEVVDIEGVGSELVLHIRENTIRPRLKHRKKSERSFPVHPVLIELGFSAYVAAARNAGIFALFPSFARGDTFGEEFVTHVKKLLSPALGRLVGMHCFRHNFETARRNARMDASAANYITGRRIDAGSAALYGGPAGLGELKEELSKIDYGLKHLPAPAVTPEELKAQGITRARAQR